MSFSQVDICNKALTHIGAKRIVDLEDNSQEAITLSAVYDMVLDAVLRDHPWGFATAVGTLAALSDVEVPGWDYVYTYPSSCVRVRKVYSDSTDHNPDGDEFEVLTEDDQKVIAADISPAYVRYTKRVTDPTLYDAMFIEALAFRLAAEIAYAIKGDTKKRDAMFNFYLGAISNAQRESRQEKNIDDDTESSFLQARG
jgi:hypothetical protein